mmetsp:Transcript_12528/g.52875  ORF Transcript_12528/g.52875 Transcript_12528/m.52875 type:complete len:374 (-) Transcript_12528:1175-2296(-)
MTRARKLATRPGTLSASALAEDREREPEFPRNAHVVYRKEGLISSKQRLRIDLARNEFSFLPRRFDHAKGRRLAKLLKESSIVNVEELRQLIWTGCPSILRPVCWKLLMGYIPLNADRRKISLGRKRIKYTHLAEKLDNDILGSDDLVLLHQIQIDLPRTVVYREFLEHAEIRLAVQRVLFTRALRNPTSSYVQGMNELMVPFLIAFLAEFQAVPPLELDVSEITTSQFHVAEADSYWCFCKFLGVMQNHYTFGQPGIQESCFKVKELLKRADSELYEHLTNEGVDVLHFAFRWLNCLFLREFPAKCIPRLMDTYLAEGDDLPHFIEHFCLVILLKWSAQFKEMTFQSIVSFIQNPPTKRWTVSEVRYFPQMH